jgi:hypothetical protein
VAAAACRSATPVDPAGVVVLATSREALGIDGEQMRLVPPPSAD